MLQISMRVGALFSTLFGAVCLWLALDAINSSAAEPISGGREYAAFWVFLTVVGFVLAIVSWTLGDWERREKDAGSGPPASR
jgi:uncharacterized membrane protein YvlD (DUF360 family)